MNKTELRKLQIQLKNKKHDFGCAIKSNDGFSIAKTLLVEIKAIERQLAAYPTP